MPPPTSGAARGQGVHHAGYGFEPSDELAEEIKAFVRDHHSAYAYPRQIEFVRELPKTLTGKIRRVELRRGEAQSVAAATGSPSIEI